MSVDHEIATREEWLGRRIELLNKEKELTKRHDELALERRKLPWVRVDTEYVFDTVDGKRTLAELFDGRSQLLVYHFMFGPEWSEGCPSCSFWADNFDGVGVHLGHRDVTFITVSRGPLDALVEYRKRMGWAFPWVSSLGNDFNVDYSVSDAAVYNFAPVAQAAEELPGLSAFILADGEIYHTYSCYGRGLDVFNGAYQLLDVAPRGRDEDGLEWAMAWLRRHDSYADSST